MQWPNEKRTKGQAMIKHEKAGGELMGSGSVTVIRYAHSHKIRKLDSGARKPKDLNRIVKT
jgi:hypothetical protein